ncbi:hypothetical protein HBN50_08540 [Halobacteriovorax sp. GB3]|uniref:hypothetical protein n=1 Tax=Halobacteriovorax sp. GB3 TaxID=2719615 RepID=UPI00236282D0|nr:hypothetical protein [Halobacteriovorax sp. GB3]MDD0853142.1 hypothetical protein [Halobacteriovorax sp. GB3]
MKLLLIFTIVQLFSSISFASDTAVRAKVVTISASGKSFILDKGSFYGLKAQDLANISIQIGSLDKPKIFLIGRAELVRSEENKSYWVFIERNKRIPLRANNSVTIEKDDFLVQGRATLEVRSHTRLEDSRLDREDIDYEDTHGMRKELLAHSNEYYSEKNLIPKEAKESAHISAVKRKKLKSFGKVMLSDSMIDRRVVPSESFQSEALGVRKGVDEIISKSLSQNRIDKTNSLEKGINQLYFEHERDLDKGQILKDSFVNVFRGYKEKSKAKNKIDPKFVAKVKKEGALWSAGLNDREIRNYLIKTGAAKEKRMQDLALNEKISHEVDISLSSSLVSHANAEDPNHQGNGYTVGLAYEYHLIRVSPDHFRWSLEFGLERGVSNIDLGGINGRFTYGNFFGGINYYFLQSPAKLNKVIGYLGGGVKRGSADVTSIDLSQDYTYQQVVLPALWIGLKYRFDEPRSYEIDNPTGVGLNVRLVSETTKWTAVETAADEIETSKTLNDIKLNLSLSVYF